MSIMQLWMMKVKFLNNFYFLPSRISNVNFHYQIRYLYGLCLEVGKGDMYGFINCHFMIPIGKRNVGKKMYIINSIM